MDLYNVCKLNRFLVDVCLNGQKVLRCCLCKCMQLISMGRRNLFIFVILVILAGDCVAMTRQQLKNTGKMLRKQCLGKTGVQEDKIAQIEKGVFNEEKEVMCYIACVYQLTQVIKNNKLSYESSIKQIDLMYPQDMKASVKATIETCKDVSKKYKDICEASYWTAKCMYDNNSKDFIFA